MEPRFRDWPANTPGYYRQDCNVYETAPERQQAFLVFVSDQPQNKIVQKMCNFTKTNTDPRVENRLFQLESEIKQLKEALFSNESEAFIQIKNRWARGDSNARPSPFDGSVFELGPLMSFFLERSTTFTKKAIPSL
jgi:hypothetical protein